MVGFQEGGEVKRQQIERALQSGITPRGIELAFRNDPEALAILREIAPELSAAPEAQGSPEPDSGIASLPRSTSYRFGENVRENVESAKGLLNFPLAIPRAIADIAGPPLKDFGRGLGVISEGEPKPKTEEPPAPAAPTGEPTFEEIPEAPAAPEFVETDDQDDDFLKMARDLMASDPQAADEARRKAAQEAYGYTPEELAELREGLDPRSRAWERFRAFGRGAAGGTSGLAALTGGSAASQAELQRQRAALAKIASANRAIREKAFGEGTGAASQAAADRLKGLEVGQRVVGSRRDFTAEQMKIAADTALAQNETLMEMAKYDREMAIETRKEVSAALAGGTSPYSKMFQEALTRLQNEILGGSKENADKIRAELSTIMGMAINDIMGASSNSGFGRIEPDSQ
jgi:hypothetical protein